VATVALALADCLAIRADGWAAARAQTLALARARPIGGYHPAGAGGSGRLPNQRRSRKARSLKAWLPNSATTITVSATAISVTAMTSPSKGLSMPTPTGVPNEAAPATLRRHGTCSRGGRLARRFCTPSYTAQMGHWAESLVEEFAQQIGGNPDRRLLTDLAVQAGREIEILSGRSFRPLRRMSSVIETNGLPFADIPDMQVGSMESMAGVREIPDPVNPQIAAVLQGPILASVAPNAAPAADALWVAGQLVAEASRTGRLSGDYVLHWLGASMDREQLVELMRRVMDPSVRFSVPILAFSSEGWWIQIARRLIWVTNETEDEGRLIELLADETRTGGDVSPLAAVEPILIAARMTRQPSDWAFIARIWTEGVQRPIGRPWPKIAKAIHGDGIPTITVDPVSTPYEIGCQVVLKGYWHGYIGSDEPALANAVAMAYPRQVERIQRVTHAPNQVSAAATLLEQLIRPGFDPAQGAEATRRYVRRKASIAVMEHRKAEAPDRYPWTQVGISERRYYKLLPQFAQKVNGRYLVDHDVVARMKAHLDQVDNMRHVRATALDVLRSHGFGDAAARKWIQRHRHRLEEAINAWPRDQRT
jgi:hypothetical protein